MATDTTKVRPSVKNLNCGSCAGLLREKIMSKPCDALGQMPSSRVCGSYSPDVFALAMTDDKRVLNLAQLGGIISSLSTFQLQVFAAILLNESKTRSAGFTFMQKVYIRIAGRGGRNYMSNFVMGYVLDATKEQVRVISETGRTAVTLLNDKGGSTLYTAEGFAPIRQEISDGDKWTDPEVVRNRMKTEAALTTLDEALDEGLFEGRTAIRNGIKLADSDDSIKFAVKFALSAGGHASAPKRPKKKKIGNKPVAAPEGKKPKKGLKGKPKSTYVAPTTFRIR